MPGAWKGIERVDETEKCNGNKMIVIYGVKSLLKKKHTCTHHVVMVNFQKSAVGYLLH